MRHDPEDAEKELQQRYLQMRLDEMAHEPSLSSRLLQRLSVGIATVCGDHTQHFAIASGLSNSKISELSIHIAGNNFDTHWHDVNLWNEPFPPTTAVELALPEINSNVALFQEIEIDQVRVSFTCIRSLPHS